jgi:hypothetical protein
VKKDCYFRDYNGPFRPSPHQLENYVLAPGGLQWRSPGGNDNWLLEAKGLYRTVSLPQRKSVNVALRMTGHPDYGVTLQYDRWDGRVQQKDSYASKGGSPRVKEIVRRLHGDPLSIGLFVSFEVAWQAVKELSQPTANCRRACSGFRRIIYRTISFPIRGLRSEILKSDS